MSQDTPIIEISHLCNELGGQKIHENLNLTIQRGEIVGIAGGSGSGKTTLLRSMLMLLRPKKGSIKIFGKDILKCTAKQALSIQHRWGVLFQHNALFSALTVLENVGFPLESATNLQQKFRDEIALMKILLAGLPSESAIKYPAELSGGMQKRAAIARAIVLDPELLFLDEPTAGLDPRSASAVDELILHLRDNLGLTVVVVTHDLDTLWRITDRVAFLGDKKVIAALPMAELVKLEHPLIKEFFGGARGKAAEYGAEES